MCFSINLISPDSNHDLLTLPIVLILKPLFGGISIVFVASWFIADSWVITIIMQCIYSNKSGNKKIDFIYFGCFISLVFCAIHWSYTSPRSTDPPIPPNTSPLLEHNICKLVLIRTLFGSLFHFCGMFYHAHIEKHQKLLFTGKNFFIAFIAISQLQYHYGDDINFLLFNAEFKSAPIWVPISTSFIGIYLFMFIAKCASKHIHTNDILIMISHETYHIMCQHMLIFLFLNIITVAIFHDKNFKVLNGNAFYQYKPEINWFIYIGSGLLVPTFLAIYTRKVIRKVRRTAVSGILAKKRDD
ncbi:unnamed protein product [Rotaria magnacalcarata]|uniref:Uncharacterized protein n=1 Tax=Rotaria magnacalcarata TaxID=392030 RepID=A0A820HU93_9BILA|nr:unnamed protein product [Rotaria magnacalcarata]CAF2140303.1 unnamed protein product [Rotaria magnacalcarata]CAF3990180.1 unnamed protein product [Rotaria magnacalcarata]CAF4297283.1 unnamed protein product [Rotaria magnacalcarata]